MAAFIATDRSSGIATLGSATFDILVFTRVYKFNSTETSYRLFYNPSVVFFGKRHLPYAIVALLMCFIFTIIPTVILIAYTFQCFQKLLSSFNIRLYLLHTFIDSFQGCFKDGTDEEDYTYDCRLLSIEVVLLGFILGYFPLVYALFLMLH